MGRNGFQSLLINALVESVTHKDGELIALFALEVYLLSFSLELLEGVVGEDHLEGRQQNNAQQEQ